MKKIILQILDSITNFFNKIIEKEAERVDKFNRQIFEDQSNDSTRPYRIGRCPLLRKGVIC